MLRQLSVQGPKNYSGGGNLAENGDGGQTFNTDEVHYNAAANSKAMQKCFVYSPFQHDKVIWLFLKATPKAGLTFLVVFSCSFCKVTYMALGESLAQFIQLFTSDDVAFCTMCRKASMSNGIVQGCMTVDNTVVEVKF